MKLDKFYLGSSSPRRQNMLSQLGVNFELIKPTNEELRKPGEAPLDYVTRNSMEKCLNCIEQISDQSDYLLLTADTIVVLGDDVLEKPITKIKAKAMLEKISNKKHKVISAYSLSGVIDDKRETLTNHVISDVYIKKLLKEEIDWYVDTEEPLDKAGSYAVQGIGSFMVEKINGSYTNVVGLPLTELLNDLSTHFGFTVYN